MTELLLIDGDVQRGAATAAVIREQGIDTAVAIALPAPAELAAYNCLVCMHELIDLPLTDIARERAVIILAENASVPAAVACMQRGAVDYLEMPVDGAHLIAAIERASASNAKAAQLPLEHFPMIGSSPPMRELKERINKVAPTDTTVLILGQSGTGKELVARALHAASQRAEAPLITLNCATVPQNLIEAELFGLEQYESAGNNRGLIEAAEGGTLFLDEIAELPPPAQARLLRVTQGENRRVGSSDTHTVDVRVIAATHRNLEQLTSSGKFREDLYYRLNVVRLDIAPLSDRSEDIVEIAHWLLERTAGRLNKQGLTFGDDALDAMSRYHWPGNVRELENAIERAAILADAKSEITQALLAIEPSHAPNLVADTSADRDQTSLEDYFVRFVLDNQDQFTETELAEKLGISRKSLWERRQRLNIPRRKTRKRGPRRDSAEK